jgi:hypothetical protein
MLPGSRATTSSCARQTRRLRSALVLAALCCSLQSGCAALTNPVADGVPVRRLSDDVLAEPRENDKTIPLNLLRQKPPDVYRLEAGDILGIYIEGVLGERNQPPPVRFVESGNLPPAMGFPIPVRQDGTVSLPLVPPIKVQGLSVVAAEEAIRSAYTVQKQILRVGHDRIIVTLMAPREYHVLVVRQDSAGGTGGTTPITFGGGSFTGAAEIPGPRKKGTGFALDLPAYENDVLNALTRTGGLPGLDAKNEVIIQRGYAQSGTAGRDTDISPLLRCPGADDSTDGSTGQTIRIPLRLPPGAPIPFKPEDVILKNGDIVFIASRDAEVFYTGGLLPAGQWPLPRDYDLNIVEAIALIRGPLVNGAFSANNLSGAIVATGIGFPNPSSVSIIRRTPGNGQVTIRVDLNRALEDPRERVLLKSKDIIILQETVGEALAQYFTSTFFKLNFVGTILRQNDAIATTTINTP